MADDLEKKKQGFLEVVLDDKTKQDLQDIKNEKIKVEQGFDNQLKALDDRLKDIQDAERDAVQKEKERLRKVQQKQTELLKNAKKIDDALKQKITEIGDKAKTNLQTGFNNVLGKLKQFSPPKVEIDNDIDLSGLSSILSQIPSALSNIELPEFPEFPEPSPTEVTVEVDTESLLTEQTGLDIKTALEGKFVNQ